MCQPCRQWCGKPYTGPDKDIAEIPNSPLLVGSIPWEIVNGSLTLPDTVKLESKDLTGSVSTPGLGTIAPSNYHKERHEYTVVMELPDNITEVIGDDALVIDLDVTISDNEAGEVQILTSEPHLELNQKSMNWTSAEAFCLSKGGHLASVGSPYDRRKLEAFIDEENN